MARSQPGTTMPPTDGGCRLGVFIHRRERDPTQYIGVNMQFLMSIGWLGLKPISSAPVLARRARRAEDGCPSARSYTVWAERLATKEEILKIIAELNAVPKHSNWQMLSGLRDE